MITIGRDMKRSLGFLGVGVATAAVLALGGTLVSRMREMERENEVLEKTVEDLGQEVGRLQELLVKSSSQNHDITKMCAPLIERELNRMTMEESSQ